jgi:LCP family protein required for cell wall assembly
MMRIRKYVRISFLILVLSLVMASLSLAGISCKKAEQEIVQETVTETTEQIIEPTTTTKEIKDPDLYTTSSSAFKNYSFLSPKGWDLFEEDGGSRVIISSNDDSAVEESIMITVEKIGPENGLDGSEDLFEKHYKFKDKIDYINLLEKQDIQIAGNSVQLNGYQYHFGEDADHKAIDLLTYFQSDGHLFIFKYMAMEEDAEAAQKRFVDFLSSFKFEQDSTAAKTAVEKKIKNILILGDDSGLGRPGGRVNGRTDTNMILSIDLDAYKATIVTIPRDTWVEIPGYKDNKINAAHAIGGIDLAVQTFENFSGLKIHNYIITDMDGFPLLIDYFGGVEVTVEENIADGFSGCYLDAGTHLLDGEQALALARARKGRTLYGGGAFAREREAAKMIKALYDQNSTLEKLLKMPALLNVMLNYTWSDLDFIDFIYLMTVFGRIASDDIEITTIPAWPQMVGSASAVVYDEAGTREIFERLSGE